LAPPLITDGRYRGQPGAARQRRTDHPGRLPSRGGPMAATTRNQMDIVRAGLMAMCCSARI